VVSIQTSSPAFPVFFQYFFSACSLVAEQII
jgi:hypothetical protein